MRKLMSLALGLCLLAGSVPASAKPAKAHYTGFKAKRVKHKKGKKFKNRKYKRPKSA